MSSQTFDRVTIVNITVGLEAALLLAAAVWIQISSIQLLPAFKLAKHSLLAGSLAGCGTAFSGFIIVWFSQIFKNPPKWLDTLRKIVFEEIAPLFSSLKTSDIFLLAISSGFCEEVFFRGVMQSQVGYWQTSILFGLFHCPSPRHLSYGLWALSAGLLFGWLYKSTGSLWVPIIAHTLSNLISIAALRYMVRSKSPTL